MAFNKNKALESALKYLNQGKVSQAITEYQQILRHDPKDQATLMTVGDLYARQSDLPHAIEYFERLAQVYLTDGFNSKAIAIYKKIAKLAPTELAPLERLADLYVQQGVLSEARPLFLQIAEVHLKANRSQKAVEVLQRLLDVEPDNPRVQMRLAELYNVMGQKKEAAHTYLSYAQRLLDRNETDEALKLVDRAFELEPANASALLLKGKILAAAKNTQEAVRVLSAHPEADTGGQLTDLIFSLEMESGNLAACLDRARKQLARGHAHFAQLLKVTEALIEKGKTDEALPLLSELREPMIEASEQDKFLAALNALIQRSPDSLDALEMLVDFCRHTSDPFRLNTALDQLADAYAAKGDYSRGVKLLEELADHNKENERIAQKLAEFRARAEGAPVPIPSAPEPPTSSSPAPVALEESFTEEPVTAPERTFGKSEEGAEEFPSAAGVQEELDPDTQRYVGQALTDADLFSSYGLTQKATHLLEAVLQRAPRHTPSLERLLDLYLGAGNERRTAEIAALLEQIHRQRGDTANADRFAEMRKRFQKAAGMGETELPVAPPAPGPETAPAAEAQASAQPVTAAPVTEEAPSAEKVAPAEFEIPLVPHEAELEHPAASAPVAQEPSVAEVPSGEIPPSESPTAPALEHAEAEAVPTEQAASAVEELDLSEEWEAMSQEVQEPPAAEPEPAAAAEAPVAASAEETSESAEEAKPADLDEAAPGETIELIDESEDAAAAEPATLPAEPAAAASSNGNAPHAVPAEASPAAGEHPPLTTDDFIRELVAEIEHSGPEAPLEEPEPDVLEPAAPVEPEPVQAVQATPVILHVPASVEPAVQAKTAEPLVHAKAAEPVQAAAPAASADVLGELADVFQEFRDELGEIDNEEEDLETHYNLGIAYREMGLLDEAVSEFQRVAKAVQKGKPFPYAMNCATLLALSFMDKQQPNIAAYWYQRALDTPGIDQETELALRYDLGVALESAGEAKSALSSFQHVYAMNIDYRDVADRISALQKHAPV
jgi:pilus assembly protein FimV